MFQLRWALCQEKEEQVLHNVKVTEEEEEGGFGRSMDLEISYTLSLAHLLSTLFSIFFGTENDIRSEALHTK